MNKKLMKLLAGMFILVMVVAGCSSANEEVMLDEEVAMDKEAEMKDEDMADDEDMIGHSDEEMKDEEMSDEEMKDEEMSDEEMKDEEMSDEEMKDEEMSDEEMKDEEMSDEEMKDEEMKDEDMSDEEMKDEDMSDEEMKDEEMKEVVMMNDGKMAPDFELMDIDGNIHTLADLKGEKVYLKYWASWCSICLAGLEEVDELFVEADGFTPYTVVTPDANGEQSKEDFITWFNGLGYDNINVLFDMDGSIAKELNVRAFPTSVFIGSDGVLIQSAPGHKSNEDINKVIATFN